MKKPLVAIDLFAGAGGLSEGLIASGINVAVSVELHPDAALTHAFNHPATTVLCADMRSISMKEIRRHVQHRTGQATVDVVVGGPPCQGFSSAGKQDIKDPRNRLFRQYLDAVKYFSPRMFVFENVPGLSKVKGGEVLRDILKGFWKLGYEIHEVDQGSKVGNMDIPTINAVRYGVPQYRERLVLVGWKRGCIDRSFLWPRCKNSETRIVPGAGKEHVSVGDAIGDLSFLVGGEECHRYMLPSSCVFQDERRQGSDLVFNHLATKHQKKTVDRFRRLKPGATVRSIPVEFRSGKQRIKRFRKEDASWTILGLPDDYVHYQRHRIPTVREMARLQSFDDDYVFMGKRTTSALNRRVDVPQYTQVGNAVPPLLARAIGGAINRSLSGATTDLRNLRRRRARLRLIRGGSGFTGYTLDPAARTEVLLLDHHGHQCDIPICTENSSTEFAIGRVSWAKKSKVGRRARPKTQVVS
ncbi:MAG: DNA cytosine methyltransferase [Planctomycetes bacterium]|nr:DNA cytosine methyltransferase [Planctomycetota bacterium]